MRRSVSFNMELDVRVICNEDDLAFPSSDESFLTADLETPEGEDPETPVVAETAGKALAVTIAGSTE